MSNQKIRAAAIGSNYCCLPEPKEQSYAFCCFVLYFLHTNKNYLDKGWITSETFERVTGGYLDRNKIGRIFGQLPHIPQRKRSSISKNNKKKSYWKWDSKKIYDLLLSWGVEPVSLKELKNPNTLKSLQFVGKEEENTLFLYNSYQEAHLLSLPDDSYLSVNLVSHYQSLWKKLYGNNVCYKSTVDIVRRLILNATFYPSNQGIHKPCFTYNYSLNQDGYIKRTKELLKDICRNNPKLLNMELYPTTDVVSRLVAMVKYPDWDWRYNIEDQLHAHHTCFNRNCLNPDHIQMLTKKQHRELHYNLGDNHPVTIPELPAYPEANKRIQNLVGQTAYTSISLARDRLRR